VNRWLLKSDRSQVGVTEEGGHLDSVRFVTDRGTFAPMHVAPWADEPPDPALPPILRILRGDFFCAPFGASDVLPGETRIHGASCNARWGLVRGPGAPRPGAASAEQRLEAELESPIMGARVRKHVWVQPGHAVVYQQHDLEGGAGAIPVGHHAMLRVLEQAYLSFSPWVWGGTPPTPLEADPTVGRSLLAYPQEFADLARVRLASDGMADLTRFPALEKHDDLLLLATDPKLPFAWSAVSAPRAGWVWFDLRSPQTLASTVLWMSHGGRQYPPWSGRHTHVIGVEQVTAYFHLGHRASTGPNPLSQRGIPTAVELRPGHTLSIRYAFGLAAVPPSFTRVRSIEPAPSGIVLIDEGGRSVTAPVALEFVT
jgi:hypothetical protein